MSFTCLLPSQVSQVGGISYSPRQPAPLTVGLPWLRHRRARRPRLGGEVAAAAAEFVSQHARLSRGSWRCTTLSQHVSLFVVKMVEIVEVLRAIGFELGWM